MKEPKIIVSKSDFAEQRRIDDNYLNKKNWLKWGPYLSERQWATVREDYSAGGDAWNYITHDMSRSKAYRWGEDGIAGISDKDQKLCFAIAMWNGEDEILKERLFGLTPAEGNHGEDVKELYHHLDNTPSHSYMKYLYKYPQHAFPYRELRSNNDSRSKCENEYEIIDTGIFNDGRYFDVFTEYAKDDDEDICIRISIHNRSTLASSITLLPTLWFRNTWNYTSTGEKPLLELEDTNGAVDHIKISHPELGEYFLSFEHSDAVLFTENETNTQRLYGISNKNVFVKDAFHQAVTNNDLSLFQHKRSGTKCSLVYKFGIAPASFVTVKLRLVKSFIDDPLGDTFDLIFKKRVEEADEFYNNIIKSKNEDVRNIQRLAFSGLLWSKQFYSIDIPRWLNGDPAGPLPPVERKWGRNSEWLTLNNEDILSVPDKWEYPWYASWDLAFHCIPFAMLDAQFAKNQLVLLLREWYMDPYGRLPAYEWSFGDVNPPVHAWACLNVYRIDKERTGRADTTFLERTFQKLLINFTWWVNRKDRLNNNVFEAGFLGLDNIGVFDRSNVPGGGVLEQADGTAWMGMYCLNMMEIALELAQDNIAYEDLATKFFEHFSYIASSLNRIGEDFHGSWNEQDGFFYDVLKMPDGTFKALKIRSLVGLVTLFAVHIIDKNLLEKVPEFHRRLRWFVRYRQKNDQYQVIEDLSEKKGILLSLVPAGKLKKIFGALLDENEFLSVGGIRSLSKVHQTPYSIIIDGKEFGLNYQPGESNSNLFGGNSNWRGPVWMPMNYLLIQALEKYGSYYEDKLMVELPARSGNMVNLKVVANDLRKRLANLFLMNSAGSRPVNAGNELFDKNEHFKNLVMFYECFHGEDGRGVGASHQTGWTSIIAEILAKLEDDEVV